VPRDADGQPITVTREPLLEVLRGAPDRTEALIDASRHQWTYRAGVISFAATDAPTEEQQSEVMDHFERLAFAGLDPEQYELGLSVFNQHNRACSSRSGARWRGGDAPRRLVYSPVRRTVARSVPTTTVPEKPPF
jgi:hypothetical protein